MAVGQFRHANSAEELAKREANPGAPERPKGFRHFNHPEEVAARARAAQVSSGQQRGAATALPPVLPVPAPLPAAPLPTSSTVVPGPRTGHALDRLASLESKVEELASLLEGRLTELFGSPEDLQALRLAVANMPAIQEQALDLRNRVRALENTWDAHVGQEDSEDSEPKTIPDLLKPKELQTP